MEVPFRKPRIVSADRRAEIRQAAKMKSDRIYGDSSITYSYGTPDARTITAESIPKGQAE